MQGAPPTPPSVSRFQRLVGFVRRLIDYGRELSASLQRGEISLDPIDSGGAATRFGTCDLRIILARVARGLLLAEALQDKLARHGNRPDAPPQPAAAPRAPALTTRPRTPRRETDQPPDPDNLPTAEQIADAIRRRSIGAVLADICRDFGITPCHPAWREVFEFIIIYDGNPVPLTNDFHDRADRVMPWPLPDNPQLLCAPVCTGPPWPVR